MFQGNEKNPLAKFVIMNSCPGEFKPAKSAAVHRVSVCNTYTHHIKPANSITAAVLYSVFISFTYILILSAHWVCA